MIEILKRLEYECKNTRGLQNRRVLVVKSDLRKLLDDYYRVDANYRGLCMYLDSDELKISIEALSKKYEPSEHLKKVIEETSELNNEIAKNLLGKETQDNIKNEMADVVNTIEVYLSSIGLDFNSLNEYRLKQVTKHL
jgi:phosphoribosyl-ATP pyrophosphohydrolase